MAYILNFDSLLSKLDKLQEMDLTEPLTQACLVVERDAKINAPADTGELRQSITFEVSDNEGVVGTNLYYAPYVEYGTGIYAVDGNGRQDAWSYQDVEGNWHTTIGQKPQPFLEPALMDNEKKIYDIFIDYWKKGVRKL